MKKLRHSIVHLVILAMLVLSTSVSFETNAQIPQTPLPSAESLRSSVIPALNRDQAFESNRQAVVPAPTPPGDQDADLRRACGEAVEELRAARKLITAQGVEIERYDEILKLEQTISTKLRQISTLSDQEKAELRAALSDKDRQVASLEAAIAALKRDRPSFWKKFGWVVVGAGAGIVIGTVLNR